MTADQDVIGQMVAAGLDVPPQPLSFGRVVRFGPKKRHWYRLNETRTDAGTYVVTGVFGDWRGQQRHQVQVDWKGINAAERQAVLDRRAAQALAERMAREQLATAAAARAADVWAAAARDGSSAYLARKGVQPESCRYLPGGALVVPLLRYDEPREQALKAVQIIQSDGTKRFTKGFAKSGCCLRLGHVVVGEPIIVCEGYATGLTLRMAVDRRLPVVVALDAGNLLPVVELLAALHPQCKLLICADDDWRTPGNPGRDKAQSASRAVPHCGYTWPIFRSGNRGPKDTDYNDLHAREGLPVVRRQLRHVLPLLGSDALNAAAA